MGEGLSRDKVIVFCMILIGCAVSGGLSKSEGSFYDSRGKRDPFAPLIGEKRQVVPIEDIVSIDDVNLEGLAVGRGGKKVVIINSVMLKEGDKVGNLAVGKISDKGAQVFIDGTEYELNLPEEAK